MTCVYKSQEPGLICGVLARPALCGSALERGTRMVNKQILPRCFSVAGLALVLVLVLGGFVIGAGSASAATTGIVFLGASNTEPAFDFMTQNFVSTANGGNSVTFTFGGSGSLAGQIDGGVDAAKDGTGSAPAGFALFASADEANVDNTIPEGAAAAENAGAVEKNHVGQCIDQNSSTYSSASRRSSSPTAATCPAVAGTVSALNTRSSAKRG